MKNEQTYYHCLSNGIRIVHRQTNSPVAWVGLMVGAGTRDEQRELNGMAHYIEHTVFKGTTHLSGKQLINRIEDVGGEINAYTTKEETTFYAAVPNRYYMRALEVIADMVFCPSFPKQEIEKEMGVILDEIESYEDSPSELIYEDFEAMLFEGNTLDMPILGTKKTLKRINEQRARQFMQLNYTNSDIVMFSQSALPMNRVVEYAERYLMSSPYKLEREQMRLSPGLCKPSTALFEKHTHQTHVMLGGRAYPLGHERQVALYLLNNILGGGSMNSRLNMLLREQYGLVYTIESSYTPLSDTGYWCVYFASEPQNTERCEQLVREEIARMTDKPLTDAALKRALRQLKGQMAIAADSQENSALRMGKLMLHLGEAQSWQQTFAQIEQLSPQVLLDTAREIYNNENISVLRYE